MFKLDRSKNVNVILDRSKCVLKTYLQLSYKLDRSKNVKIAYVILDRSKHVHQTIQN